MTHERKIEFFIAVNTSHIRIDIDAGKHALDIERKWNFKDAIKFDAERQFGRLEGTVDPTLKFNDAGRLLAEDDTDPFEVLKKSAQERINLACRVEQPPQLGDDISGCEMTAKGWQEVSGFTVICGDTKLRWNLAGACAVYETGNPKIEPDVLEYLMMAQLYLVVRMPLIPNRTGQMVRP